MTKGRRRRSRRAQRLGDGSIGGVLEHLANLLDGDLELPLSHCRLWQLRSLRAERRRRLELAQRRSRYQHDWKDDPVPPTDRDGRLQPWNSSDD